MELIKRPRRLRGDVFLRKMVRETRMDKSSLMYPIFVREGSGIREEIPSMPGQYRYSLDQLSCKLESLVKAGVGSVLLFGIPDVKDEKGSQAYAEDGIVQRAIRQMKRDFPELYCVTDVCLCEYTSHGHCGMLCGGASGKDRPVPCSGGSGYGGSFRYDGRKNPGHAAASGRQRPQGDSHHVLRGKIRVRFLRTFP